MNQSKTKLILYMATSINGHITHGEDDSGWVSKVDWKEFDALKRESGVMIMGSGTYRQFENDFPQAGALNVVMTHNPKLLSQKIDGAIFTDKSPREVREMLEQKGFTQLMLIGGMTLNTAFLNEGLIDEIWIDVHPLLIGEGKTLFKNNSQFKSLELFEIKDIGSSQVILKYRHEVDK